MQLIINLPLILNSVFTCCLPSAGITGAGITGAGITGAGISRCSTREAMVVGLTNAAQVERGKSPTIKQVFTLEQSR